MTTTKKTHDEESHLKVEEPPQTHDDQQSTAAPATVGRVEFETADGLSNGAANYGAHPSLRDRVLLWRHQLHEANHQKGDGTWVYRATHTSGFATEERDPALTPIEDTGA